MNIAQMALCGIVVQNRVELRIYSLQTSQLSAKKMAAPPRKTEGMKTQKKKARSKLTYTLNRAHLPPLEGAFDAGFFFWLKSGQRWIFTTQPPIVRSVRPWDLGAN